MFQLNVEQKAYLWDIAMAHVSDFVALIDKNGRFYFLNRTAPGYTMEEVLNAKIFDFIDVQYQTPFKEAIDKVFRTGNSQALEVRARGSHRDFTIYKCILCFVKIDKECEGILIIGRDVGGDR